MSLGFLEIIREVESEIKRSYLPGCIHWADDTHDGAWSKAVDRFDKALTIAVERFDEKLARKEGEIYRDTVIDLIKKFKAAHGIADQDKEAEAFFSALRAK